MRRPRKGGVHGKSDQHDADLQDASRCWKCSTLKSRNKRGIFGRDTGAMQSKPAMPFAWPVFHVCARTRKLFQRGPYR